MRAEIVPFVACLSRSHVKCEAPVTVSEKTVFMQCSVQLSFVVKRKRDGGEVVLLQFRVVVGAETKVEVVVVAGGRR
jgi:hypothetical protein